MQIESFSLHGTYTDLLHWIRRYAEVYPPPGCRLLRLVPHPPAVYWDQDRGTNNLAATVYWVRAHQTDLPLFDINVSEADGLCAVTMQRLAPHLESWFGTLLDRLAPERAAYRIRPLPALPERSSANTPATQTPATEQAESAPPTEPPPAQPTGGQEEAAQLPQPSASSSESTGPKRGPKGHSLAERDQACEEYWKGQPHMKQFMIADKYDISARQFQRWWKDYAKRHGLT